MTHNRVILSVVLVVSVIVLVVILRGMGSVPIAILRGVFAPNVRSIFIPDKKNLPMTFTPQAPDGNWAEPWQNACEETDIVMVDHFYRGEPLTPEKAKTDIVHIFSVKEQRFGVSKNESVDRMVEIINAAGLTWKARVVPGPTIEAMQQEIVQGRPVIVPVDARLLFNPYYSNITPEYHTLVLSGYDVAAKNSSSRIPVPIRARISPMDSTN